MYSNLLSKAVSFFLKLIFAVGVLAVVTFPLMLDFYIRLFPDYYSTIPAYRLFIIIFCVLVGLLGLWLLLELILIFKTLTGNPFTARNVYALKRMGYSAILMALLFFAKCIVYMTPMTIACGIALLLCGLFSIVLAGVFSAAVSFKAENDLTI